MKTPFNLNYQNKKIEFKIVVALERVSEAFRVLLWNNSKENGLSPIQIQMLIFLRFHSTENATIGYLAKEFNLSKATVSDSMKTLMQKGYASKTETPIDARSFRIALTPEGEKIADASANFAFAFEKPIHTLSDAQKEIMLNGLLTLIADLNKAGIITLQRMCFSCAHYSLHKNVHYCNLLNKKLATSELRIDCPEHLA